ncbi:MULTISPECIES: hypothetical protein [Moraxella]|jgi:membrane protein|uniref:Uncharacterized protein n=3 Tax=Moraxella TaxID=475 RepID=A0A1B8PIV4_MORNO|nr:MULTISPECIES: hypothetical protein [Moraxella]MBE9579699.1 hypothetical protein [Moraxella sp. K1664]MBE9589010.1 hypothetical protein [Moraxella sp. K1630]MBE9597292.1 hypothetical protein [Moraxella sp. K2450]MCG7411371.1 hypothetical protein [Moraxella nonliquefaciens]MDH9219767.1 hypothetical protein [Moraxella lacunata]
MPHSHDTIKDWIMSNRLYEVHIFYYTLIIIFWVIVGFVSLGFEIGSFSSTQNLLLNFVWYLTVCLLMITSLIIFCNTYEANKYKRYLDTLEREIEEKLTDEEKEIVCDLIQEQGHTLPTNKQRYALLFVGCYALFELFVVSAWIKDMTLIWQPDWVLAIIEWVKSNSTVVSVSANGGSFFSFNAFITKSNLLYDYYQDGKLFLNSELGKSAMFMSFIKLISFVPVIYSLCLVFWKMFGWISGDHLMRRASSEVWGFIWVSSLVLFMNFVMLLGILAIIVGMNFDMRILPIISGKLGWLDVFGWNLFYLCYVFGLHISYRWLCLIFRPFINLFRS